MDRDAKLAAARKKLDQFKRKKGKKAAERKKPKEDDTAPSTSSDSTVVSSTSEKNILEIKKSEEFIDEKFEVLNCLDGGNFSEGTAATTETILQVSAKLNGIATEADMFIDDASVQSSEEKFQMVEHPKTPEREAQTEVMRNLEQRNVELASKLSSSNQENEQLSTQRDHLIEQVKTLQTQLGDIQQWHVGKSHEDDGLRDQLQVQMQTIGVLVSEKQDLQQELLTVRSELHVNNLQQKKFNEETQTMREKIISYERELQTKTQIVEFMENTKIQLDSEYEACKVELGNTREILEKEQLQSSELALRLQSREAEYRQLHASYADASEKLGMADVLLQQLSAGGGDSDSIARLTQMQHDNEALHARVTDYERAFEQLTAEREHLNQKYIDAHNEWEDRLQNLREKVQTLETEKQILSEDNAKLEASLQSKIEVTKEPEIVPETAKGDVVENEVSEDTQALVLLREEIQAQQRNNEHLSLLVQEKESRINDLEKELDDVKTLLEEHQQLLDGARSDKLTISRALVQNKQLKEQLEEIQDGFIRMSNDKMDLATQVSSLEHTNKDLQLRLAQGMSAQNEATQNVERSRTEVMRLQQSLIDLQHGNQSSLEPSEDETEIIDDLKMKLRSAEERMKQLTTENAKLRDEQKLAEVASLTPSHDAQTSAEAVELQETIKENLPPTHDAQKSAEAIELQHVSQENPLPTSEAVPVAASMDTVVAENNEMSLNPLNMLQDKFTSVMREKAELLNRIELLEHTNTQLQDECDTIGEYIALYHNQRQVLKSRHHEKDEYISTIVREREAMQGKIEQLQTLVMAMLNNRQNVSGENIGSENLDDTLNGHTPTRANQQQSQPDLVPKSDIYISEEENKTISPSALPGRSKKVHTSSESSSHDGEDATASQILNLLEQMQKPIDTSVSHKNSMPSGFCMHYIGPYTAI